MTVLPSIPNQDVSSSSSSGGGGATTVATVAAAPADIMLAEQKDTETLDEARVEAREVLEGLLGPGVVQRWRRELDLAIDLMYFTATTLMGKFERDTQREREKERERDGSE